ncbi:hypothetical protein FJY94_09555, partial [Candidatus Kaiserbacteria bacterium]|nr:hypothetical protein [Candidatus Kaiserbacteria bacterium]
MTQSIALKPITLACAILLAGGALAADDTKPAVAQAAAPEPAAPEPLSLYLSALLDNDRRIQSARHDADKETLTAKG